MTFKSEIKPIAEKYKIWSMIRDLDDDMIFVLMEDIIGDLSLSIDEIVAKFNKKIKKYGITEEDQKSIYKILHKYKQ